MLKMPKEARFLLVAILVAVSLMLTACAEGLTTRDTTAIDSSSVSATMQYLDKTDAGPAYDVAMEVPSDWVNNFRARNLGNVLYFDYTGAGRTSTIFSVEALSMEQYWQQSGGYPGSYVNIVNRGDTYFIYHLPIDAYSTGLTQDEFDAFAAQVPEIIASFAAEEAS